MSRASEPSIARRLFSLSWPIIGLNVLAVLALAVDTAMCGRLDDAETALAALGFATQVIFLLMVAMMGLTVGTVALVARAHGAGDAKRVNHILIQSTMLTVLVSIGVAVLGNLFAGDILWLLGAEGASREQGVAYLRPLLGGAVFYYLNTLYAAVLRGVGNTRLPFLIALGSNVLNVALNYGLILGNFGLPALGVGGAAIGTLVSYAAGTFSLVLLLRRNAIPNLHLPLRPEPIDGALARELFVVGAPAAADMVILNAAFMSIVGMLGRIDHVAVAAHGVGLRIQALAFVPGLSISQATSAMVGNALGAKDPDQARSVVRASIVLCTAVMSSLAVAILAGAYPIVDIFDIRPESTLEAYSVMWIRLLGYGMPIVGVHIALTGMLRGAGATLTSLLINLASTLGVQIPLSLVLGFVLDMGAFGIWLAFPLSFALKAALGIVAYRHGGWARVGMRP